ncbi:MAG: diphosphomevalonate/mevalonate 3,5-bisphosphate decarboxylase family protein [Legionella sp.]
MQWSAQAPSNIALIKYMGKKDSSKNLPSNSSLSYTLNNLLSTVTLELHTGTNDRWEPLTTVSQPILHLSPQSQNRFLRHLQRIKQHFDYQGHFIVRSTNNFPHGSGLASSASSFAALTKCAALAFSDLTRTPLLNIDQQAALSRLGSGSSCRSFFPQWALWSEDTTAAITLPFSDLLHQVIIIDDAEKLISSSEAHQRVQTSHLYPSRYQRAEENLQALLRALNHQNWKKSYQICWQEFEDMHQLFNTSVPSFRYMTQKCQDVLQLLQQLWEKEGDGPLVTMDAGPNIHLLYRSEQTEIAHRFQHDILSNQYNVL